MVHNYYGSLAPSGENRVFEAERALLQQRGHEVSEYVRHNDTIRAKGIRGLVQGAFATPWNPWAAAHMRHAVEAFRPEVVHVHNTFPLLSPAIFFAIGNKAAKVLTLHNYRLFCAAAIPMRNGHVCTECLDRHSAWPALRYGCYRGNRLASIPLALSIELHRKLGTWMHRVDAFITLTDFQRDKMIAAGLPANRVYVKPNFFSGYPVPVEWQERGNYAVYAGRLSAEKGVEMLIQAWLSWGSQAPELRVLGNGPLRNVLEKMVMDSPTAKVRFMGQVSRQVAHQQIANAKLMVMPSLCFEGFPMAICEAFAFGTPLAVSNIGPFPSVVRHGVSGIIFSPGDVHALVRAMQTIWNSPTALEDLSAGARVAFEHHYNEVANYQMLTEIYSKAMAAKREVVKH
ncbi:MAG: glycosyltransferase family 4 protein [Gammaproteobacteria bacterium]|nr:glycosyltransferase family 4 protein [Gammaproteobacteria bacterium]MDH3378585.1 glycosyltransferase family 4 protein [Gammaproteobacteria bacterium]